MERYKINSPHIVSEVFADAEAAIINLKTGNYYSLNKTATEIWSLIEKGAGLGAITNFIAANFNVGDTFETTEITQFIEKLINEDLIIIDNNHPIEIIDSATDLKTQREYESPILECYADMQELLLLDPIHEVEETNWLVNKTH